MAMVMARRKGRTTALLSQEKKTARTATDSERCTSLIEQRTASAEKTTTMTTMTKAAYDLRVSACLHARSHSLVQRVSSQTAVSTSSSMFSAVAGESEDGGHADEGWGCGDGGKGSSGVVGRAEAREIPRDGDGVIWIQKECAGKTPRLYGRHQHQCHSR